MKDKIPPQAIDAEMSVLGAMLMDKDAISRAIELIKDDYFYRDAHRKIYQSMISLYEKNEPVDIITIAHQLQRDNELQSVGGAVYLTRLLDGVPTSANIEYYAKIVQNKYFQRRIIQAGILLEQLGHKEDVVEGASALLEKVYTDVVFSTNNTKYTTTKGMHAHLELLEQRVLGKRSAGIETCFPMLTYMLAGLQKGKVYVVAGATSMGKSTLALNIMRHLARNKISSGIISLESSQIAIFDRLLSSDSAISASKIAHGELSQKEIEVLSQTMARYHDEYEHICVSMADSATMEDIASIGMRMQKQHGIELLVIDHIGLITPSKEKTREREIGVITRKIAALAKRLKIPIIEISQLSRELRGRQNKRPILSDLRDSGSIEQDADVVMFVYRDKYYNAESEQGNIAEIIVAKNRDGKNGMVEVLFQPEFVRFVNLEG